jgi:hypothetical protein
LCWERSSKRSQKQKKLNKEEIIAQQSDPVSVLKWNDKKAAMTSTYHGDEISKVKTELKEEIENPLSALHYTHNMIGVDLKDQLLHTSLVERKTVLYPSISRILRYAER